MAQEIPVSGSTTTITVPGGEDAADVPSWLENMAKDLATLIAERATTGSVSGKATATSVTDLAKRVSTLEGNVPGSIMRSGRITVKTNANGNASITHGLGGVPKGVVVTVDTPTGIAPLVCTTKGYFSTQFSVDTHQLNANGSSTWASKNVTVAWIAWR